MLAKERKYQSRMEEAEKNLQRIQKTIAPFVKEREYLHYSTDGKWVTSKTKEQILNE